MKMEQFFALGAVFIVVIFHFDHVDKRREAVREMEMKMEAALADRDFHAEQQAHKLSRELEAMREEIRLKEAAEADREWARNLPKSPAEPTAEQQQAAQARFQEYKEAIKR